MIDLDSILLLGAVVGILAIMAARLGTTIGLPSLLLFLGLGMAMGNSGLGIDFHDADLAHALGFAALVLILAEGGLSTKWVDIRPSMGIAGVLATGGVVLSIALMTVFGHFVLGLDLWIAVLLGAVTSPTDAAAVFSVLRRVPLPSRLRGVLEAESGLNDAPTVLLVVAASALAQGDQPAGGALGLIALVIAELGGGVLVGLGLGWVGVWLLRRVALPSSGLYPLAALVWTVFAYGVASGLHVSGFAAVYVAALVLGNGQLPHRAATKSFVEGIGWIAQIGLFVMLGLLADPGRVSLRALLIGLVAGLFLTLVARPLSVVACTLPFRMGRREQAFLSWAGLRGAVPIVLATIPLSHRVEGSEFLFDVVLVFVIVFTCIQGPTLPWVARRLGLVTGQEAEDIEVEAAPLDRIQAELLQVRIPAGSRLAGVRIGELRLPTDTVVSLIIRDRTPFAPGERDPIRVDDELLIVTPTAERAATEKRLRAVAKAGRLARWRGEQGTEEAT